MLIQKCTNPTWLTIRQPISLQDDGNTNVFVNHAPPGKSVAVKKKKTKTELQFCSTFCRGSKRPLVCSVIKPKLTFSFWFLITGSVFHSQKCLELLVFQILDFLFKFWNICIDFTIWTPLTWCSKCFVFYNILDFRFLD